MKKLFKKSLLTTLLTSLLISQSLNVIAHEDDKYQFAEDYIMEPMPKWYPERFTRGHLDVKAMMKDGFSRLEALEIQNQMKDTLESDDLYNELEHLGQTRKMVSKKSPYLVRSLKNAIKSVKEDKYFESSFMPEKLKKSEFYIAFDLDETLLIQWYKAGLKGPKYYDYKIDVLDYIERPRLISPDYVTFIPGWEKAINDIAKIPGCKGILFFTAKEDKAAHDIIDRLKINGKPAKEFIKGFFTRNHLIRETSPTKLSKDLRMIDEKLEHVILIDDNPTRILNKQLKNLREFPKFNADAYVNANVESKDKVVTDYYEKLLPVVVSEIKESAKYAKDNNISFVEAYHPYSMAANAEILMLMKQGHSMEKAVNFFRKNTALFEPRFFFYQDK